MEFLRFLNDAITVTKENYKKVTDCNLELSHYDSVIYALENQSEDWVICPVNQELGTECFKLSDLEKEEKKALIEQLKEHAHQKESDIMFIMDRYNIDSQSEDVLLEVLEEIEKAFEKYSLTLGRFERMKRKTENYKDLSGAVLLKKEENVGVSDTIHFEDCPKKISKSFEKSLNIHHKIALSQLQKELKSIEQKFSFCKNLN